MSDAADMLPLRVDVAGLPRRVSIPVSRSQRWSLRANAVQGVLYLVLAWQVADGPGLRIAFVVLGGVQLAFWLVRLVLEPRASLQLSQEGVRRVGLVGRGRLTPWADVAEVRPPDAWHEVSHLRGHGRFPETTDLPGLTADDARELQRRLTAAREGTVVRPEGDRRGA